MKIKGKRTIGVAIAAILTSIVPALQSGDVSAIDTQTIFISVMAIFGRMGVANDLKKRDEMPGA